MTREQDQALQIGWLWCFLLLSLCINAFMFINHENRVREQEAFAASYQTNPVCDWAAKKLRSVQTANDWKAETESQKEFTKP